MGFFGLISIKKSETNYSLPEFSNYFSVWRPISVDKKIIYQLAQDYRSKNNLPLLSQLEALDDASDKLLKFAQTQENFDLNDPELAVKMQLILKDENLYFSKIQKLSMMGAFTEEAVFNNESLNYFLDEEFQYIAISSKIFDGEKREALVLIILAGEQVGLESAEDATKDKVENDNKDKSSLSKSNNNDQDLAKKNEPNTQSSQQIKPQAIPSVNAPTPTPRPRVVIEETRVIPDQEVLEALNNYRRMHSREPLREDGHLCAFAEKRAIDLENNKGLDNHEGFRQVFADPENLPDFIKNYSGNLFGENLAQQHCKNMQTQEGFIAQTGTALIEWCFDSSTMGHREAQLSRDYNKACVRHRNHMYVVIFGN